MIKYKNILLYVVVALSSATCNRLYATKIAFVINELSFRGVEVSTFDYAHFNETLLGNESIIINFDVLTDNEVRKKFASRFENRFFDCSSCEEMDYVLEQEDVDILYYQKPGHNDKVVSKVCKNAVHAVFPGIIEPHGDVYAFISAWFVPRFANLNLPFVPYIVRVEETHENLRKELNIPEDALVFGRHGGYESFNVPCAHEAVKEVAKARPDIYFLFLNTKEFCCLPNVIFLPKTTDMLYKAKFINTCDAMVHARWRGETFGLACAEFSIKNKPVITWTGSKECAHVEMLADKGMYYHTKQDLIDILLNFKKCPEKNWDAYSALYSPEKVMQQFDEIFIQPLLTNRHKKMKRKLDYKAIKHAHERLNEECLEYLQRLFNLDILIQASMSSSLDRMQAVFKHIHVLTTESEQQNMPKASVKISVHRGSIKNLENIFNKHALILFDAQQEPVTKKDNPHSLINRIDFLTKITQKSVIVIEHVYSSPELLEHAYTLLTQRGYQFYLVHDTVLAFNHKDISVPPIIRAMTMSSLCDLKEFAQNRTLNELLAAERLIGLSCVDDMLVNTSWQNSIGLLWNGLSLLYHEQYEQAATIFQHVIEQGYTHWRVYWYLGCAWHKLGDQRTENAMVYVLQQRPDFKGIQDFKHAISA